MRKGFATVGQVVGLLACGAALGVLWGLAKDKVILSRAEVAHGTYADVIMTLKSDVVIDARKLENRQNTFGLSVLHLDETTAKPWRHWNAPEAKQRVIMLVDSNLNFTSDLARLLAARWSCRILICQVGQEGGV
ncbi:hypothetical protein BH11VER1_BH11VER1_34710 [soil metagenome]